MIYVLYSVLRVPSLDAQPLALVGQVPPKIAPVPLLQDQAIVYLSLAPSIYFCP